MEKLDDGIGDSVRPNNKLESQGESIQDSCKTSNLLNIFKQDRTYRQNHCFTMLPCTI